MVSNLIRRLFAAITPEVSSASAVVDDTSADASYVPRADEPVRKSDVLLAAYYLPQFHPIPENDEAWGEGFTEWTNVRRASPAFAGHYQPREPDALGYYDLRDESVLQRQVELAHQYGIGAFVFHFYWFGGRRPLEAPVELYRSRRDLNLPYMLCWANEPWTRRWDGRENEVIIPQQHSADDDIAFIRYLNRHFLDERYLKVDGKPVLTIYRPSIFPDIRQSIARWREETVRMGYPGIYLIATNAFDYGGALGDGFDALSEFPPHGLKASVFKQASLTRSLRSRVRAYASIRAAKKEPRGTVHPGVMPGWDNSARRPDASRIYHGATPDLFRLWLERCMRRARANPSNERMVFINAWNEWAEAAYLEPDRRYGYAYLAACAAAHSSLLDAQGGE